MMQARYNLENASEPDGLTVETSHANSWRAVEGRRRLSQVAVALMLGLSPALSVAQADAFGETWPAGEGREFTGAFCGGCHSLNLVKQQGLTRHGWDKLLYWMTEKQNMPPLAGEKRDEVLDYLATNFNIDQLPSQGNSDQANSLLPLPSVQGIILPILEIDDQL